MPLDILNTSIAVTATAHNPSILHPSFLVAQNIIPAEWADDVAEGPVSTPALSIVKFANGVVISADPQRFQVVENTQNADPARSPIPSIAQRYVRVLPHVRYAGVGVNLSGFFETADGERIMRGFIAEGNWTRRPLEPTSVGVRFVYPAMDVQLRVAIDAGTIQIADGETRAGVIVAGNYHADLQPDGAVARIEAVTNRYADYCRHFIDAVSSILQIQAAHAAH